MATKKKPAGRVTKARVVAKTASRKTVAAKPARKAKAKPLPELRKVTKSGHKVDYKRGELVKFTVPRSGAVGKGKVVKIEQTRTGPFIHIDYSEPGSEKAIIPIRPSMVEAIKAKPATKAAAPKKAKPVKVAAPAEAVPAEAAAAA